MPKQHAESWRGSLRHFMKRGKEMVEFTCAECGKKKSYTEASTDYKDIVCNGEKIYLR